MPQDIAADIAAILHPLPSASEEEYAAHRDEYDRWTHERAEQQLRIAEQLRRSTQDDEIDPLITALHTEVEAKRAAEDNIRELLAYGREFVRPRGYTLESLATAVGMSISGVRTAYTQHDIEQVAEYTGAKPRDRRTPDAAPQDRSRRPDRTYNYMGDAIPDRTIVNYMGDHVTVVDDRDPVDILAAADRFLTRNPTASEHQIADDLGVTVGRLRLLRQHFDPQSRP